jgi:xylose isomerase
MSLPTGETVDCQGGNKQGVTAFVSARDDEEAYMAKKIATDGTLFMALEWGAVWPGHLNDLKNAEANLQAVVQANGETAEHFAGRTLERWHRLLDSSSPPHRFVLGARANPDARVVAARKRIADGVFENKARLGASELILWSGDASSGEEQGRLLELAGTLVKTHCRSDRSVRVLFGGSSSSVLLKVRRAQMREFGAA